MLSPSVRADLEYETRRNDRIIKVERRTLIGDAWRFEETRTAGGPAAQFGLRVEDILLLGICGERRLSAIGGIAAA